MRGDLAGLSGLALASTCAQNDARCWSEPAAATSSARSAVGIGVACGPPVPASRQARHRLASLALLGDVAGNGEAGGSADGDGEVVTGPWPGPVADVPWVARLRAGGARNGSASWTRCWV